MAWNQKFRKSEISLHTGDSASNAIAKRSVLFAFAKRSVLSAPALCRKCVFVLWTSRLRAEIHYYYMWPFAKKLYHGWINTMTSSNEISWKLPPPKWRAGCVPAQTCQQKYVYGLSANLGVQVWSTSTLKNQLLIVKRDMKCCKTSKFCKVFYPNIFKDFVRK